MPGLGHWENAGTSQKIGTAERGVGWVRTTLRAAEKKRWEDRAHDVRKGKGPDSDSTTSHEKITGSETKAVSFVKNETKAPLKFPANNECLYRKENDYGH